jgi:plastocyanin domain-containing protein
MKNTTILVVIILLVVGGLVFMLTQGKSDPSSSVSGQEITLSMQNYNYYPNTIEVEAGKSVSITLDSSIRGCYRSFNIPDLGVSKTSANPDDKIVFTPTQKGTFRFRCSMGMGTGTIIVK